jgi:uncharacterized protein (UPF0276 family)
VSDHLSWSRIEGFNAHDLLPLPYTEAALDVVCANLDRAQCALGRTMLIENPSSYVAFASEMSEWEFLGAVCARTGCGLLLDVNNIYVSAVNHGFDPLDYIAGAPLDRVRQIHLAGHSRGAAMLIDTHDQPVCPAVWALFGAVVGQLGPVATLIERDDDIPPLAELLAELDKARAISARSLQAAA